MNKRIEEYAELLLKCVKLEDKRYLFVEIPNFLEDFIEILKEKASKYDLIDIHFEIYDPFKKHELLVTLDQEDIYKHPMFDKSIFDKYAKLDAAFIFIQSMIPGLMDDVDSEVIKNTSLHVRKTQKYFRDLYESDKLNWCIAAVPNELWAKKGLKMSLEELWNKILDICLVSGDFKSYDKWIEKINNMIKVSDVLNNYKFEYLKYTNSLGTDLKVYLPLNHVWKTGFGSHGEICNLPTEEIFTSPDYKKTEGVVYSSKPLYYNNVLIDNFSLTFKDGKVREYHADHGEELLKTIIETDDYSCYLGECALVSYDSPINNTGIIFNETLFDENASCHLALGRGFVECLDCESELSDEELRSKGINVSNSHVDFMIGTNDLKVVGVTRDNREITIIENGNLII